MMVIVNCFYMFIIIRRNIVKPNFSIRLNQIILSVLASVRINIFPFFFLETPIVSFPDKHRSRIMINLLQAARACMHPYQNLRINSLLSRS